MTISDNAYFHSIDILHPLEQYIDIHTHHARMGLSVLNRHDNFEQAEDGVLCSLGLHPWYLSGAVFDEQLRQLEQYAQLDNVLAIGECGLDKVTKTEWTLQVRAFTAQVTLANRLNKPLIIHCVRAYEELLRLLKEHHVNVPVIFHGFNKSLQVAERILAAGYFLSFGAALQNERSHASAAITHVPTGRLFLETDDAPGSIKDIYKTASILLKTDVDALNLQLQKNFHTVFKI